MNIETVILFIVLPICLLVVFIAVIAEIVRYILRLDERTEYQRQIAENLRRAAGEPDSKAPAFAPPRSQKALIVNILFWIAVILGLAVLFSQYPKT